MLTFSRKGRTMTLKYLYITQEIRRYHENTFQMIFHTLKPMVIYYTSQNDHRLSQGPTTVSRDLTFSPPPRLTANSKISAPFLISIATAAIERRVRDPEVNAGSLFRPHLIGRNYFPRQQLKSSTAAPSGPDGSSAAPLGL